MSAWDPWRGCHRYSDGCRYCYIHKGDARRGVDTETIVKTTQFDAPIRKNKNGEYRMRPGGLVYLCFRSDFLLEMIRERADLQFLFLTKRIVRFMDCVPADWGEGYENVTVGCTVENQRVADERLPVFRELPIRHKNIICQPMIAQYSSRRILKAWNLWPWAASRIAAEGCCGMHGCWTCGSNALRREFRSDSGNAQHTLKRTANSTLCRRSFCAHRRVKPRSIPRGQRRDWCGVICQSPKNPKESRK